MMQMIWRVLSCLAITLGAAAVASAGVITVNTLTDEYNSGGNCSLREAVEAANTDTAGRGCVAGTAGGDSILFDAPLNGEIVLSSGEISVSENLEIVVEPALRIGVRAAPDSRIFTYYGGILFRVQGIVLSGGRPSTGGGGAIYGASSGQLEILSSILRDNQGHDGGAVYAGSGVNSSLPVLLIQDSRFSGNQSTGSVSTGRGGAVFVNNSSDFSDEASPSVVIKRSVFTENEAGGSGGAIYFIKQYVELDRLALLWNQATSGGGGAYSLQSSLDLQNLTLAQNQGSYAGGLMVSQLNTGHRVRVGHVTVTGNEVTGGKCAGICFVANSSQFPSITVFNSIVADNTGAADCDDLITGSYDFTSGGYNVFGDVTDCTTPLGSDLETVAPLVFYLGEILGDTIVALPASSSPVLDQIPEADCDDLDGAPLVVDQRGGARPLRSYIPLPGAPPPACDSGALERKFVEFAPWIFKDDFETGNALRWSEAAP